MRLREYYFKLNLAYSYVIIIKKHGGKNMKIFKKLFNLKAGNLLACAALVVSTFSANGCVFIFHQESLPDEIKKLRRF